MAKKYKHPSEIAEERRIKRLKAEGKYVEPEAAPAPEAPEGPTTE